MYCIYVWRPIMEAISTLENIRPSVVSRWSQKVNNCLRLQCQNILLYIIIEYSLTIWNIAYVLLKDLNKCLMDNDFHSYSLCFYPLAQVWPVP